MLVTLLDLLWLVSYCFAHVFCQCITDLQVSCVTFYKQLLKFCRVDLVLFEISPAHLLLCDLRAFAGLLDMFAGWLQFSRSIL